MQTAVQKDFSEDDLAARLNRLLTSSLTGINQYFLHARMLKHMGFMRLADMEYKESLDAMKHTDQLVSHILVLGAVPNMQELGALKVGHTVHEMLKNDLALVEAKTADIRAAVAHADAASMAVLEAMLAGEARHRAFLQGELNAIDETGLNAYLQSQT